MGLLKIKVSGKQDENTAVIKSHIGSALDELQHIKIDGLPNIIRSKHIYGVVVWTLTMLAASSICALLVVGTISQYLSHAVSTNIRRLPETKPPFPTVTICSHLPFNTDFGADFLKNKSINNLTGIASRDQLKLIGIDWSKEETEKMDSLERMMISCLYQNIPCNISDFEYMLHPFSHNCYRFNAKGTRKASISGSINPLKMELYTGLPDSISASVVSRGVFVIIQNATDYPYNIYAEFIDVSARSGVFIAATRTIFSLYPTPYSECAVLEEGKLASGYTLDNRTLFDAVVETESAYSQGTCFLFCQQMISLEMCNCTTPSIEYRPPGNHSTCLTPEQVTCVYHVFALFTSTDLITTECTKLCPFECETSLVDTKVSFSNYPYSDAYVESLRNSSTLYARLGDQKDFTENLRDNLVSIDIFYPSLSYTRVEEEPKMSLEDLIGALGGHLHLFMGMSLMSFIEIFEFAVLQTYTYVKMRQVTSP